MARGQVAARFAALAAALGGCSEAPPGSAALREAIVHGTDDRREHFEADDPVFRSVVERSLVALVPRSLVTPAAHGLEERAESWGERAGLCPGERFEEQPSAAFCTGVLVDWDLVLAAGHCAHVLPLADTVAVFGYYYRAPEELALGDSSVFDVVRVVHERLGDPGDVPRLDHVWLSLGKRVKSPFEPALVHVRPPALAPGDAVSVASTVGGVPQKLDQGGSVRDARTDVLDYFVADTDTSEGSSGGGAFDRTGALLGVLVRGAADYALTQDGCFVTVTQDDPAAAEEQFGYASRAVEELCADEPETSSLCRDDCEVPCRAAPRPPDASTDERQAGCSLGAPEKPAARGAGAFTLFLLAALSARRRRTALSRSASTTAMLDAALRCLEKASRARG